MAGQSQWGVPDIAGLLRKRAQFEQTTSANAGAYPVPFGAPVRASPIGSEDAYDIPPEYAELYGDEEYRQAVESFRRNR